METQTEPTMANHCVSTRLAESKTLTIPSLDRNVGQVYNDTTLLENRLQILTKSNTHLPHDLIMQFTDLYPKEDLFILGLNTKVYSSFIHNSPTLGTTHVSVDWWMGEWMDTYRRILTRNKQKLLIHSNLEGTPNHTVERKEDSKWIHAV